MCSSVATTAHQLPAVRALRFVQFPVFSLRGLRIYAYCRGLYNYQYFLGAPHQNYGIRDPQTLFLSIKAPTCGFRGKGTCNNKRLGSSMPSSQQSVEPSFEAMMKAEPRALQLQAPFNPGNPTMPKAYTPNSNARRLNRWVFRLEGLRGLRLKGSGFAADYGVRRLDADYRYSEVEKGRARKHPCFAAEVPVTLVPRSMWKRAMVWLRYATIRTIGSLVYVLSLLPSGRGRTWLRDIDTSGIASKETP